MYDSINEMERAFRTQTGEWFGHLQDIGIYLLLALATISLAVKFVVLAIRGQIELGEILTELVKKVLVVGWFLAVILNAQAWTEAIRDSLLMAANIATSTHIELNPGGTLAYGVELAARIVDTASWDTVVFVGIIAIGLMLLYAAMTALMLYTFAEFYILSAAGSLFLGLGGSEWTEDAARQYLRDVLGISVRLFGLYLVMGMGEQMIDAWVVSQGVIESTRQVFTLLGVVLVLFLIAAMVPASLQRMVGGNVVSSLNPVALMQGTMSAAGGIAGGAIRAGAGAQAAASLTAAQAGAGSLREAVWKARAGGASPVGAVASVAGRTGMNVARGIGQAALGRATGGGATSAAGALNAARHALEAAGGGATDASKAVLRAEAATAAARKDAGIRPYISPAADLLGDRSQ